jgi:hypothetical protein
LFKQAKKLTEIISLLPQYIDRENQQTTRVLDLVDAKYGDINLYSGYCCHPILIMHACNNGRIEEDFNHPNCFYHQAIWRWMYGNYATVGYFLINKTNSRPFF